MLDLNIYLIIGQILTFLAALFLLWRIAYRPIAGIFKQRADKIGSDLAAAEKTRQDVERMKADYDAQLARLKDEAQNMMNQTVRDAQSVREEILNAAKDQSQEMLKRAIRQIELEKEKAVKELRQQVLEMSLLVDEMTIGETVNADLQRRMVDELFSQFGGKG